MPGDWLMWNKLKQKSFVEECFVLTVLDASLRAGSGQLTERCAWSRKARCSWTPWLWNTQLRRGTLLNKLTWVLFDWKPFVWSFRLQLAKVFCSTFGQRAVGTKLLSGRTGACPAANEAQEGFMCTAIDFQVPATAPWAHSNCATSSNSMFEPRVSRHLSRSLSVGVFDFRKFKLWHF